jgi:hypothetical protein
MDASSQHSENCPAIEALSAWHDGELVDDALAQHLESCEHCQEAVAFFQRADTYLEDAGTPSPQVLARIQRRTRKAIEPPAKPSLIPVSSWAWVGMAAAVAVGLLILKGRVEQAAGLVAEAPPAPTTTVVTSAPEAPAAVIADSQPADVADDPAAPRWKSNTEPPETARQPTSTLRLEDVTLVGVQDLGPTLPAHSSIPGRATEREVSDYVHHVWLVNDPTQALGSLRALMPEEQREVLGQLMRQKQGHYRLHLGISDRNLQALVNYFGQNGLDLVSPAAPQPDPVHSDLQFSGKSVHYQLDFVKR